MWDAYVDSCRMCTSTDDYRMYIPVLSQYCTLVRRKLDEASHQRPPTVLQYRTVFIYRYLSTTSSTVVSWKLQHEKIRSRAHTVDRWKMLQKSLSIQQIFRFTLLLRPSFVFHQNASNGICNLLDLSAVVLCLAPCAILLLVLDHVTGNYSIPSILQVGRHIAWAPAKEDGCSRCELSSLFS
jgi:hypothetical protein